MTEFTFDARTIRVLKNFASINQSIMFRPGTKIDTVSREKLIVYARADLDQEIPAEFGIYDLPRLFGALSLFSNPKIDIGENDMLITSEGKKLRYRFAAPSTIRTAPVGKEFKWSGTDESFQLPWDLFKATMGAVGVLKMPEIAFVGTGERVFITTHHSKSPGSDEFKIELGASQRRFNFVFKTENLMLLQGDYTVDINTKKRARFSGDRVEYFVAPEEISTID